MVGFFGLNQKPTSSKDPYALRRLALGVIRIIVENKKDFKIKDLINYSSTLYLDQGFEIDNQSLQNELSASICKVDLLSELVGEFPELQGV